MSLARNVESYFDTVASTYHSNSQGLPWSLVRRREQAALLAVAGALEGADVLELGCGAGYYTRLLLSAGAQHVWAVDFSAQMIEALPAENVTAIHADAATVDPGRSFDVLVSAGMLEFVPDPAAVFRNAARLARDGARFAILYPTLSLLGRGYRHFHRRNGLEIRLFDAATLTELARPHGWHIAAVRSAGPFSAAARLEKRG